MLYLAPYETSSRGYGWSPIEVTGRSFSAIDLRSDFLQGGDCLLWMPGPEVRDSRLLLLAADPEDIIPGDVQRQLSNRLSLTLQKTGRAGDIVGDLMINDRGKWKVMRSDRNGLIRIRTNEQTWYTEQRPGRRSTGIDPTDNFNRTNENPLVGDWTTPTGGDSQDMELLSNEVRPDTPSTEACAYWNVDTFDTDHFSEVIITARDNAAGFGPGPTVRMETTNLTGYFAAANSVDEISVYRYTGTLLTFVEMASGGTCGNTDLLRLEVSGDDLDALVNGTSQVTVTNTNNQTQTRVGIQSFSTPVTAGVLDDWQGGDLAAAAVPPFDLAHGAQHQTIMAR